MTCVTELASSPSSTVGACNGVTRGLGLYSESTAVSLGLTRLVGGGHVMTHLDQTGRCYMHCYMLGQTELWVVGFDKL